MFKKRQSSVINQITTILCLSFISINKAMDVNENYR